MDQWTEIRRRVLVDGQSMRSVQREFHLHWKTLRKILDHPEPPGYRQARPRPKPKIGPFLAVIRQILEDDRKAPPSSPTPPSGSSSGSATSTAMRGD
jgi:hypothetical protein